MTHALSSQAARYRFGDLTLDLGVRSVARGGLTLPCAKLTYELLVALVEIAPNVATHDHLAERVWRQRVATPETIAQRVKLLRQALSDDAAAPRYIAAVRGQGYRLIPAVEREAEATLSRISDLAVAHATARPKRAAPLVGREQELTGLARELARVEGGDGRVALIVGEPGIGKTHLAETFAADAERAGATVLFGRCHEEPGSPPYWPWHQALAEAAKKMQQPDLAALLAADAEALGLAESAQSHASMMRNEAPNRARQFLFHTVVSRLAQCAQTNPIVLVFDNLHWADEPSLRALEFLGRSLAGHRILLVGTYRDAEIARKHPLFNTLGALARETSVERFHLRGLPEPDVKTIVERTVGQSVSGKLIEEIHRQTDGNPFFVTEVARVIAEELVTARGRRFAVRVPDSIRETIGRHLNRLSDRCNEMLAVAAVIGRIFEVKQLQMLMDAAPMEVLARLEEAIATGIVTASEPPGRFQFTHALIAETLYDELPLSRRVALHRDVARMLEKLYADRIEPFLGQIARHYHRAAQAGDLQKAVSAALAAAAYAERVLADEDAAAYYQLVLELFEMDGRDHSYHEAAIHLAVGRTRWRAGASWQVTTKIYTKAMECARAAGNRECFVAAACESVYTAIPATTQTLIDCLDEALTLIEPTDLVKRARILCRKATALHALGRHAEAEPTAHESIEVARRSGDTGAMCDAFSWSLIALRARAETLGERIRLGEEALALARALAQAGPAGKAGGAPSAGVSSAVLPWQAQPSAIARGVSDAHEAQRWLLLCYQEAGDMRRVKAIAAELSRSVEKHRFFQHDHFLYFSKSAEALCALMDGRWTEARELIFATFKLGSTTDEAGAEGVFSAQMFHLHRELGQLRQFEPILRRFVSEGTTAVWSPALALLYTELEDLPAARTHLDASLEDGIAGMPWSELFVTSLVFLTETCVAIGEESRAAELYPALQPYSGQMAIHPTAVSLGPADRYLGMLAQLSGRPDDARAHFEAALEQCSVARSRPWLAHTQHAYAGLLSGMNERSRAAELIASARLTAHELGMSNLAQKIERAVSMPPEAGAADAVSGVRRRPSRRLRSVESR